MAARRELSGPLMTLAGSPTEVRPRRRGRRTLRVLLALVVAGILVVVGAGLFLQLRLAGNLSRVDGAFSGLTDRPARASGAAADAVNILVLTTDRRPSGAVTEDAVRAPGWAHARSADSVMLFHLDGDRRAASAVTIPLDTPVQPPGGATATLGSVLPSAAPAALVGSIERLSDVRVDHLAVFDWAGFEKLLADNGGVALHVPGEPDGSRHLSPGDALRYVSGGLGAGEGSIRRQEYFIRALLDETLHQELRKEPLTLYRTLDTVSRNLAVESGWSSSSMRNLVISLRSMRSYAIQYVAAPADGASLWSAVRSDTVADWSRDHPDSVLAFATG